MAKRKWVAVVLEACGVVCLAVAAAVVSVAAGVGVLGGGLILFGIAVERGDD